jgi:Holliday junction resolvasome RuvABC endonuclease subunit
MLSFPGTDTTIKIISIDPGTTKLGVCFMTIDMKTRTIVETIAMTVIAKPQKLDKSIIIRYNERMAKIMFLTKTFSNWLYTIRPVTVVSEGPFFNRKFPGAYGPLVELINSLKLATIDYSELVDFNVYEPSLVKKGVGALGNSGKDGVKLRVLDLNDLNYKGIVKLAELDEHSIDAIAVGYTHFTKVYKGT